MENLWSIIFFIWLHLRLTVSVVLHCVWSYFKSNSWFTQQPELQDEQYWSFASAYNNFEQVSHLENRFLGDSWIERGVSFRSDSFWTPIFKRLLFFFSYFLWLTWGKLCFWSGMTQFKSDDSDDHDDNGDCHNHCHTTWRGSASVDRCVLMAFINYCRSL